MAATGTSAEVYQHVSGGRRPVLWIAAGMTGLLFAIGIVFGAPWWIWLIWVPPATGLLYILRGSPVTLVRADTATLVVRAPDFRGRWPLDEIETVEIASWDDGPDTVKLDFGRGQTVFLPEESMPPGDELAAALTLRGVHVKRL